MSTKPAVAVIGGGSWATALVKILSNQVDKISWWLRSSETVEFVNKYHHNPNYLSDVEVNLQKVSVTNDLKKCIASAEIVILAVPSAFLKPALENITSDDFSGKIIFSAIKGIVPDDLMIVGDFLHSHYHIPLEKIGVITG